MQSSVLFVLLILSIAAWVFTFVRWANVQRWWYLLGSKKFLKQPNLDVGAIFLLFCANLVALSTLTYRLLDPVPIKMESSVSKEANAPATESAAAPTGSTSSGVKSNSTVDATPTANAASLVQTATPLRFAFNLLLGAIVVGLMIVSSRWLYGTTWYSWGLGTIVDRKLARTVAFSWLPFLLLVPPVLLLHELISILIPYQHSTVDSLRQLQVDRQWTAVVVTFLYTAGWTPVVEELMFRVVVQGFAEQYITHRQNFLRWVLGPLQSAPAKLLGLEHAANIAHRNATAGSPKSGWGTWSFWAPIAISSLLFALAHSGQGAAPIPLYVLAVGLGFLYKTTGNLWLCVLIHAYLNGLNLTRLLLVGV